LTNTRIYNINRLVESPAIAQSFGLSFQRAITLIIRARGEPNTKRIPARNPPGAPHPKPGIPIHPGRMNNQGKMANKKLLFPIEVDCALLIFSFITDSSLFPRNEAHIGVA
jgi:hypothetical protein